MIFKISRLIHVFFILSIFYYELVKSRPFAGHHFNLMNISESTFKKEIDYENVDFAPEENSKSGSESSHWNYEDSYNWNKVYDSCNGNYQSPINIDPSKAIKKSFPNLVFGNYDLPWSMSITNNGHTVLVDLLSNYPADKLPFIRSGGLPDQFNFAQLHFHWGGDSGRGSEHLIQSKQFSGEVHIVHYNSKYGSFAKATKHKDGLAVLAIFMKSGQTDSNALNHITRQFEKILKGAGQTARLQDPILLRDLLPDNVQNFYQYTGSLTTPSCQEVVSWTVFETPIIVSENQLKKFRQLFDKKGRSLNDNYRPIQEERGRIITYHSDNNLQKYTQTEAQSHQQFKSWDEKTLDFFKNSAFNSKEFFKWQPFKDIVISICDEGRRSVGRGDRIFNCTFTATAIVCKRQKFSPITARSLVHWIQKSFKS